MSGNIRVFRGVDERDLEKDFRDQLRRGNDLVASNDFRRPHQILSKVMKASSLPVLIKPVVSTRGGDVRHLVKQGREKAQFKKATSVFTQHTHPQKFKVGGGYIH